jgi:hypothetical protein
MDILHILVWAVAIAVAIAVAGPVVLSAAVVLILLAISIISGLVGVLAAILQDLLSRISRKK